MTVAAAGLPVASVTPLIGRVAEVGVVDTILPGFFFSGGPLPPLYGAGAIGDTTQLDWPPLTREPSQGPDSVIGLSWWRSTLTTIAHLE
jgi:hypothetical protein